MQLLAQDEAVHRDSDAGKAAVPVAVQWAQYAGSAHWADLPAAVQGEAVRCQINWLAVAIGGSSTVTVERALSAASAMGSSGPCTVIGHARRLDPIQAGFMNALSASAQAYDDTHLATITHPGAPVVAAAWSVAEHQTQRGHPVTPQALLYAIVMGIEIQCRLSNAIVAGGRGAHLGWYTTGLSGGVGAALTTGLLINLSQAQLICALGLAAAQASGVRSTHGSMATAFVPAFAARNGITSAYLAGEGFTCTNHVLDGTNGLFDVLSPHCQPELLTTRLGSHFEMQTNAYKPYPCGIVIHAAIDACLAVRAERSLKAVDIAQLELWVHPSTLALCGKRLPEDELDAQVSLFHWAACALLHPGSWIAAASLKLIQDADCRSLQTRINASADPSLGRSQARARMRLADGSEHEAYIEHATASARRPMSDAELEAKFLMLAQSVLSIEQSRYLLTECRALASATGNPVTLIRKTSPSKT